MPEAQAEAPPGLSPGLLAGQRILVTGGGSGLGLAMARRFRALGAELVLTGRRADVLAAAAEEIGADHHPCDIRDPAAVALLFDKAGPVTALVNNAAANFLARSETLSHRALDAVLATTLHGAAYCTLEAGRRWIGAGTPGVVLSILTLSALQGGPFTLPSAIAKAGLLAMTRSLAVEWGRHGIRLVAIAPGSFPTPAATSRLRPAGTDPPAGIPLGREGDPAELADLAAVLLSPLGGYVTGEVLVADGGKRWLAGARSGLPEMLRWEEADWARQRAATPAR